jgi:hypothetical protein
MMHILENSKQKNNLFFFSRFKETQWPIYSHSKNLLLVRIALKEKYRNHYAYVQNSFPKKKKEVDMPAVLLLVQIALYLNQSPFSTIKKEKMHLLFCFCF